MVVKVFSSASYGSVEQQINAVLAENPNLQIKHIAASQGMNRNGNQSFTVVVDFTHNDREYFEFP